MGLWFASQLVLALFWHAAFYHAHVLTLQYSDWFIPHFTLYRNQVLSTQEPRFYLLLVVPRGKIFSDMKVFQPGRIVGVLQGKWRAGKKKSRERVVSKPLDFWRGCGSHHITSRSRSVLVLFWHAHSIIRMSWLFNTLIGSLPTSHFIEIMFFLRKNLDSIFRL